MTSDRALYRWFLAVHLIVLFLSMPSRYAEAQELKTPLKKLELPDKGSPVNNPSERFTIHRSELTAAKEGVYIRGKLYPYGSYKSFQSPQGPDYFIIEIVTPRHNAPDTVMVEVVEGHVNLWPFGGTKQCGGARFSVQRGFNQPITIRCGEHDHKFNNVTYDGFIIHLDMDNDPVVKPDMKGARQSLGDLRKPRGLLRGFVVKVDWW